MLQPVHVTSLADAARVIEEINSGRLDQPQLTFDPEFAKIYIKVDGPKYNASIPAELARGIWEFQEAFYKAAAFALYGVEDARRLTRDQRRQFELVFEVSEGSTELLAKFGDFLAGLATGFDSMDSKHKAATLVAIGFVAVTGFGGVEVSEHFKEVKLAQVQANLEAQNEAEKTRQFQLMAHAASGGAAVEAFRKASEKGTRAVIESAPDATEIQVGAIAYDQDDIQEVNQRAARDKASAWMISERFTVQQLTPKEGVTRLVLRRADGAEFGAILQEEDLTAEESQKIWEAARSRKALLLQINATIMRGVVKGATIIGAPDEAPPTSVASAPPTP